MSENYNLFYFFKQFPDEDSCRKYLEKRSWVNTPTCSHCGNAQKIYRYNYLLFPHCLGDFIPENDPVSVLDVIVKYLDVSAIEAKCKGNCTSSFALRRLVKVILYAYLENIHSGSKLEAMLKRDVNFTWLSGMHHPDFNTINLF